MKYRMILTSPDMCLKHDGFRQLLSSSKFVSNILAFIVDEAHCISQWGDNFRDVYRELGSLRAFVPLYVPFLASSATLRPMVLVQVRSVIHIQAASSYHVNLGNDRPNIAWYVHRMNAAQSDLDLLAFLIPPNVSPESVLTQTMVFFNDINLAMKACRWLRSQLPVELRGRMMVYNSRRTANAKKAVLKKFRDGRINILLTTEAAGMVCFKCY